MPQFPFGGAPPPDVQGTDPEVQRILAAVEARQRAREAAERRAASGLDTLDPNTDYRPTSDNPLKRMFGRFGDAWTDGRETRQQEFQNRLNIEVLKSRDRDQQGSAAATGVAQLRQNLDAEQRYDLNQARALLPPALRPVSYFNPSQVTVPNAYSAADLEANEVKIEAAKNRGANVAWTGQDTPPQPTLPTVGGLQPRVAPGSPSFGQLPTMGPVRPIGAGLPVGVPSDVDLGTGERHRMAQKLDLETSAALARIEAQGKNSLATAAARPEPVYRIQTTDEDGNAVTIGVPRSAMAGQEFSATPTADMRNRQAGAKRAHPTLDALADLSKRINTQQGAMATISGAAEKAKAKINLNDDVAEYQAIVASFVPIIARALGHTGVLTELDVQSAKSILPAPGDSDTLAARKLSRVKSLMDATYAGGAGGRGGGGGETPPPTLLPGEKLAADGKTVLVKNAAGPWAGLWTEKEK